MPLNKQMSTGQRIKIDGTIKIRLVATCGSSATLEIEAPDYMRIENDGHDKYKDEKKPHRRLLSSRNLDRNKGNK